ncbi:MAG: polyribonucleotide nucleotidyltransferase [Anaerolineales bacterium]|nr:polyribonucleotide nucleotidyltransferase [Chloroflexota bacterium]MBL6982247.1 polyribonucleotide nucleotidyltransferase [Anaerolineales bacterium]
MKPEAKRYEVLVGDKPLVIETGRLAGQAGGAVTIASGDALIMGVATMGAEPRDGIDFLPLTVDYEERMYAGGTIPGSFFRREGRPSEIAVLVNRLTDRPLRPLFPKDLRNAVQVIMYAFSADDVTPLDILALNAASAAVTISDLPWDGPVGAVRIGLIDGEFVVNPTYAEMDVSDLDLRLAGTRDAVLMVECSANELSETQIIEAVEFGHQAMQPIIDALDKMAQDVGKPKREYPSFILDEQFKKDVLARAEKPVNELYDRQLPKAEAKLAMFEIKAEIIAEFAGEDEAKRGDAKEAFDAAHKAVVRSRILDKGVRPDGRDFNTVRPIWCDVGTSPRAHGVGLFTRGETQVMTLATLGTPRDAQRMDNLTPADSKRYIHHYNFPPFSVGEARFLRGASRRDIGHGALAERALLPMIPDESEFPYTLRLVSEVLASNGSSSMASVCGSTLALMDTGVPIKAPVSGVAMGLVLEGDRYAILTDIQGMEDHLGDMDFKVAGTENGITALQMDIKIKGLSAEIMAEALAQAKEARAHILEQMLDTIAEPRAELKPHVPRIVTVKIPSEKIGAVIGPGGKIIRSIQEETGVQIDIEEDGTVFIASADGEGARLARERIEQLTETPEVGRIYTGKVTGIQDFGCFVEITPGQDGLVHISQLDTERVQSVEDVVSKGDEITVMVTEINQRSGKIRLSRKAVLEGWTVEEAIANDRPTGGKRRPSGGGRSSNRRDRGPRRN